MIRVDLGLAVGIYIMATLGVFVSLWWVSFRSRKGAEEWNPTEDVRRCPYCGQVFIDQLRRGSMKCPFCESYLEESNAAK